MAFYDLDKEERKAVAGTIQMKLALDIQGGDQSHWLLYFSDADTYIRKTAYLAVGKIYKQTPALLPELLQWLHALLQSDQEQVRQTVINAAGEIGIHDFDAVAAFMEQGLFDAHHCVRNAVIGSIKKMGEKNPVPVLAFANRYLHHPDKEIRREICHGIELQGRTHPQDILPMLQTLEHDTTARVRNTLIHVLGQISYKKGCLETVVSHLESWENQTLVTKALEEIIDVHDRYKDFAIYTQQQAREYIEQHYKAS